MSRYIITGGKELHGEVSIRGAKNASYKQIIASILSDQPTQLSNIPKISDIKITESIAQSIGSNIEYCGDHCLKISTPKIKNSTVPIGTGEKSRTSFMFSAPLLVRTGKAIVPTPGGDKLGARPLDRLFDCFTKMGIETKITDKIITFNTDKIKPVHYIFNKPSHTVTETVIMAATFANGQSIIDNAAREPETDDLISMINDMGGQIKRDTTNPNRIIIDGVKSLSGTQHQIIPDRNEVVTFACAALATKGSVSILHCSPETVKTFINTIDKMGAKTSVGNDEINVSWTKPLKNIDIETGPEPRFMTDWQAVFSVLLTQTVGRSSIIERVYPSRFQHIENLKKMGVKVSFFNPPISNPETYYEFNQSSDKPDYHHGVKIYGPTQLKPAKFTINDLRAGASTVLAALTANGTSTIDGVEFIERGYEKLAERLSALGANIEYIKT